MPRRYSDFPDSFIGWNIVSSLGSAISIVAVLFFVYIIYDAFYREVKFLGWTNNNGYQPSLE